MTTALDSDYAQLNDFADWARIWLYSNADIWTTVGRHPTGLFAESLCPDGQGSNADRRLFVQARHIFSICQAAKLGWNGPASHLVSRAIDFLIKYGVRPDGLYVHSFTNDCQPTEAPADLYDQAFILLALAHANILLDRADLLQEAVRLVTALDKYWLRPDGTYREGDVANERARLQNPHMHLLEAFLALYQASGNSEWKRRALDIAILCQSRFIDRESGSLVEVWSADWTLTGERHATVVEPGHCFEWAWLLEKASMLGFEGNEASDRLVSFARQFGIDSELGVAVGELSVDGELITWQTRLWPQTERLKAAIARYRRSRDREELLEIGMAFQGLQRFLNMSVPGTWRDKLCQDGSFIAGNSPGSSFYHIVCSFDELIDISPSRRTSDQTHTVP